MTTSGHDQLLLLSYSRAEVDFFTARRYASAVLAIVVCLCVCLSQAGIVSKTAIDRMTQNKRYTITQGLLVFLRQKIMSKFERGHPPPIHGALNGGGVGKSRWISTNDSLYLEKTV